MTKGVAVLNCLRGRRQLKKVCKALGVSYQYAHSIACELSDPSYKFMASFMEVIPPEFWFQKATTEFLVKLNEQ